ADKVATFALDHFDLGPVIDIPRALGIVAYESKHQGIQLDGRHFAAIRSECNENIGTTARSDNECVRPGYQTERQGAIPIPHTSDAVDLAVPFPRIRPGIRVDVEAGKIR